MSDNTKKAQCIHCFQFFLKDSNSTLKNHISHPHCEALKRVSESGQSSMSRDGSIFVYNPDVLREQFAGLVIQRGLPFNHFDEEQTTRVFQKHLQPKYNHVSRTTLKRDAIKLWVAAKQAIIDGFANLNTNVNLTTDVWSAPHGVTSSYICVTAHWIEPGTWQMMKRVIAFEDFLVPHTGSALARTLRKTFVNFNLENKIMSITLDNASNNTSAIGKLKLKYEPPIDASESAFSTSGRVLSIRRARLTPASLEMCMCLKDHLDAQERKQHKSGLENPINFEEEILNAEVQQNEAIPLSEEEIALDVASSEGTMSGSGSGGEEVDYDMTNYGYDDYE
ncbi:zinc finger BED domain-containing protein RICESLEEPER 2-like protein [Tanacetum coccineum]